MQLHWSMMLTSITRVTRVDKRNMVMNYGLNLVGLSTTCLKGSARHALLSSRGGAISLWINLGNCAKKELHGHTCQQRHVSAFFCLGQAAF
eukprot:3689432-Amphidinium_carterae.1